jgi:hypothetical protein
MTLSMHKNEIFELDPPSEIVFKYYSLSNILGDLKIKNVSAEKILFRVNLISSPYEF